MKKKYWLLLLPIFAAGLAFAQVKWNEEEATTKDQVIMELVQNALTTTHYQPKPLNDELSEEVFDLYLEYLDENKYFFTRSDIDSFSSYRQDLDDELKAGSLEFFELTQKVLTKRREQVRAFYAEILSKPFDFNMVEEVETDPDKLDFAKNEDELREIWRKNLKYRVLMRVHDKLQGQRELSDEDKAETEIKTFEEAEKEAREREKEIFDEWFTNFDDFEHMDWLGVYLNSFTNVFDPHTEYFPPSQKEDFEISMTGQLEGIGAQLSKRGSFVTVEKIISGSACWRQGDLEVGDKILMVGQGEEEPVDVVGMNINKVVKLIRGPKGTEVRLTVKKRDGSRKVIPITRDVVEIESTFARSAIIGTEQKIGYIRLPKFYVDFYSSNNHNCAEDVKQELLKLKKEGVNGVILDLRGNGGGSLQGVIDMVGLFIEEGPVVQVKSSLHGKKVYEDRDRGIYWDGPLLVMTNEFSASASEIFASAIQDYKRGIIMGTKTTYGKGTVQNMFDMDQAIGRQFASMKPLGALKLTIQKYYRINGGTPQLRGVTPDIEVPGIYDHIDLGEKEQKYALPYDRIESLQYPIWNQDEFPWQNTIANSMKRIADNEKFARISEYANVLKKDREDSRVSLHYATFEAEQDEQREQNKRYEDLTKTEEELKVAFLRSQLPEVESDSTKKKDYEAWHRNLRKDLYLHEAYSTVKDM
ncbi:MAG: carboxy terminal-processing peptidase [Bacteroidota bacterium]|nr:carboxy terminal-processing peptidase [Bacteroidota bacterium]MDX5506219.1 carboxy terminal-processing peptidase [Bacteroidota bacterium]